ncbi:MAG: hypothetical protein C0475_06760 [Planctomyces sp.]|nr:hypothetical protein [Planctomyces sp.]
MPSRPDTPGDPAPRHPAQRTPTPLRRAGLRLAAGVAASALGLVVLAACAPDPRLTVAGASLIESTPEADVVRVRLVALNPGRGRLNLDSVRYAARSAGAAAGSASVRRSPEANVVGGAEQPFEFPVVMPPGSAQPGAQITLQGRLTYKTEGTIPRLLFDWGLYRPSVGFSLPLTVLPADTPTPTPTPVPTPTPTPADAGVPANAAAPAPVPAAPAPQSP